MKGILLRIRNLYYSQIRCEWFWFMCDKHILKMNKYWLLLLYYKDAKLLLLFSKMDHWLRLNNSRSQLFNLNHEKRKQLRSETKKKRGVYWGSYIYSKSYFIENFSMCVTNFSIWIDSLPNLCERIWSKTIFIIAVEMQLYQADLGVPEARRHTAACTWRPGEGLNGTETSPATSSVPRWQA